MEQTKFRVVDGAARMSGEYTVRNPDTGNTNDVLYFSFSTYLSRCTCRSDSDSCGHIEAVEDYWEANPPEVDLRSPPERPDSYESDWSVGDGPPERPDAWS